MSKHVVQRILLRPLCAAQRRWVVRASSVCRRPRGRPTRVLSANLLAALFFTLGAAGAHGADITVRMVDTSKDGPLTFEPIFVKANVGDTLVFTPSSKGHTTESLLVPDGAKPWKSEYDKVVRVVVEKEGIYLYGCEAHRRMGMVGVAQVGQPVNLDAAKKAATAESAQFVMNKDRFATALAQVH